MNDGLRIFRENTGAPIEEVVTAVTKTSAKELGLYGELGSLSAGKNADITIFDDALTIERTIVAGRDAYSA